MSKKLFPKILAVLLSVCMVFSFAGCGTDPKSADNTVSQEVQNLEKLCKVWGYTKYRHPAFYNGEKDWDEELLNLIPQVRELKTEKEVNKLLCDWFESLGELDYGSTGSSMQFEDDEVVVQTDSMWTKDEKYLGEDLSAHLQEIREIPTMREAKTKPIDFTAAGTPDFSQEKLYENMDYADQNMRLLALFRFWNIMEYYCPYLDVLDEPWEDQLPIFIPQFLEGSDQLSYEKSLSALATKLQDSHISWIDGWIYRELGDYAVPVELITVEGKVVIVKTESDLFKVGDVVLAFNGIPIEDVIADRLQYIPTSNKEKLAQEVYPMLLRSTSAQMEVTVLRDGEEKTVSITVSQDTENGYAYYKAMLTPEVSHELLENNIGLINPYKLQYQEIPSIMEEFKETDGLIIDLRQYPYQEIMENYTAHPEDEEIKRIFELCLINEDTKLFYCLAPYFNKEAFTPFEWSYPVKNVPGTFVKKGITTQPNLFWDTKGMYYYDKKVVVLINELTMSHGELAALSIMEANRDKVVAIGENTKGALGAMTSLYLPGYEIMTFSGCGTYNVDGKPLQRVGIAPDMEVKPTIEGIKEGRDELKEAAITYLTEQK